MTTTTGCEPLVIDSSGWLEYITADSKSQLFAPYFGDQDRILVPALVLFEVRKILLARHTKTLADNFVSDALRLKIIPVDTRVALDAAALSIQFQLSSADAIIYATAQHEKAQLITSDSHFKELPGVTLI